MEQSFSAGEVTRYRWQRYFARIKYADVTPDMEAALICREFGWTWQEYQEQPADFIDEIAAMLCAHAEAERRTFKQ